jgi:ATP-dependent DNA helicase PIF1
VTYLYQTNAEVKRKNHQEIVRLGTPIALIESKNTGKAASMKSDKLRQLESSTFMAVGAVVLLTNNLFQAAGLCNGSIGTVVAIIYKDNEAPPQLPECVWVDFGEQWIGPPYFPESMPERKGWVPIAPMTAQAWTNNNNGDGFEEHTRTMLPIRLSWAWTIWKAQGQTMPGKIVLNLGKNEKEHGLTYVAFSRATKLRNIGIEGGLTCERFTVKIKNQAKMKARKDEEQRLRNLVEPTIERVQAWLNRTGRNT